MKAAVLAALVALAAAQHDDGRHFINWDMIEHPIVETFHWSRPFPDDGTPPMGFETTCNILHQFHAKQFKFKEFYGETLRPYGDKLTEFYTRRPYPGHWDGVNEGGDNRDLIMMEWREVPKAVRDWIEEQMIKGKTEDNRWTWLVMPKAKKNDEAVTETVGPVKPTASPGEDAKVTAREIMPKLKDKEKVVFFVAASAYDVLPLWVAQYAKCKNQYTQQMYDLKKYHPQAKDDSVIAWVTFHSKPDKHNNIRWKIRAETVTETEHGRHHRTMWEKLHQGARRAERKYQREERRKEGERMKDEL